MYHRFNTFHADRCTASMITTTPSVQESSIGILRNPPPKTLKTLQIRLKIRFQIAIFLRRGSARRRGAPLPSRCPRGELPPYSRRSLQSELARSTLTLPPGIGAPSRPLPPCKVYQRFSVHRVGLQPTYLLAALPDTAAPCRRQRQTCSPPACLLVQEEAEPVCPRRSRAC
jgi:hypothetical protein